MIKKTSYSLFIFLFFFGISSIKAQININAGANSISGESIVIDYTIGEAINQTISDSEWTIIAGIQQGYEVYVSTEMNDISLHIDINLYPNPAAHYIELSFDKKPERKYEGILYNSAGQQIKRFVIDSLINRLEIAVLTSGSYILQIKDATTLVKTFKIIKN